MRVLASKCLVLVVVLSGCHFHEGVLMMLSTLSLILKNGNVYYSDLLGFCDGRFKLAEFCKGPYTG